jgi:hypothetical protein
MGKVGRVYNKYTHASCKKATPYYELEVKYKVDKYGYRIWTEDEKRIKKEKREARLNSQYKKQFQKGFLEKVETEIKK